MAQASHAGRVPPSPSGRLRKWTLPPPPLKPPRLLLLDMVDPLPPPMVELREMDELRVSVALLRNAPEDLWVCW